MFEQNVEIDSATRERLSAPPGRGMRTVVSACATISADNPCASDPNTHAVGAVNSSAASSALTAPSSVVARICSPPAESARSAPAASVAVTTGIANTLPADARRHFALKGSTLWAASTTAAAPIACASRM